MIRLALALLLGLILIDTSLAGFFPKAFEADFLQEKRSALSKRVTKTNLKIKYEFPSNFYLKEVAENTLYICNAKKVWIYTPPFMEGESGFLRTGSSNKYCYSKIFDALKKGLTDNVLYKVSKLKGGVYRITFEPSAKEQLGLTKLDISFKGKQHQFQYMQQMKLYYIGDKHPTILKPNGLKVVSKFPAKVFKFNTPKNTEVKKMK